jgi:hypothetical protein
MNINSYLLTYHALISFVLFQYDMKRSKMNVSDEYLYQKTGYVH